MVLSALWIRIFKTWLTDAVRSNLDTSSYETLLHNASFCFSLEKLKRGWLSLELSMTTVGNRSATSSRLYTSKVALSLFAPTGQILWSWSCFVVTTPNRLKDSSTQPGSCNTSMLPGRGAKKIPAASGPDG